MTHGSSAIIASGDATALAEEERLLSGMLADWLNRPAVEPEFWSRCRFVCGWTTV